MMAKIIGIVSSLCGIAAAVLIARVMIAQISSYHRLSIGASIFVSASALLAWFFLPVGYRLTFNRPNRYGSILGVSEWRCVSVFFAALTASLVVGAVTRHELDVLLYAFPTIAASYWCWMRALRLRPLSK
jgi:uncharacterized membrane protein YadS